MSGWKPEHRCTKCDEPQSRECMLYNSGVCEHCGFANGHTVTSHYEVAYKEVFSHWEPRFFGLWRKAIYKRVYKERTDRWRPKLKAVN